VLRTGQEQCALDNAFALIEGHPTPGTLRSAKKVRVEAARACGRVANPLKLFHDQALAPEGGRVANPLKLSYDQALAPEGAQPFPFFGKGGPGEAPSHFCAQTKSSTLRVPFSPALAVESAMTHRLRRYLGLETRAVAMEQL
jgi:hypothetical protein